MGISLPCIFFTECSSKSFLKLQELRRIPAGVVRHHLPIESLQLSVTNMAVCLDSVVATVSGSKATVWDCSRGLKLVQEVTFPHQVSAVLLTELPPDSGRVSLQTKMQADILMH